MTFFHATPVLIGTLWNVNDLECFLDFWDKLVLIGTLWNVNDLECFLDFCDKLVLIGTLWNVNKPNTAD